MLCVTCSKKHLHQLLAFQWTCLVILFGQQLPTGIHMKKSVAYWSTNSYSHSGMPEVPHQQTPNHISHTNNQMPSKLFIWMSYSSVAVWPRMPLFATTLATTIEQWHY